MILFLLAAPVARLLVDGQLGHAGAAPAVVAAELRALALALPFAVMLDVLLGASRGYRVMGPTVMVDRIGRPAVAARGHRRGRVRRECRPARAPLGAAVRARGVRGVAVVSPYSTSAGADHRGDRHYEHAHRFRAAPAESTGGPTPLHFWRFTAPRGVAAVAQITIQRIDIVLVAILRGPVEAAIYTAATRFLVAGQFANVAIMMAAQPRFTEMFAQDDRPAANRVYQATTAWLILLTWPLYLLAVVFGLRFSRVRPLVPGGCLRHGDTRPDDAPPDCVRAGGHGPGDRGPQQLEPDQRALAVVVNVGLDVLLIPRYGIAGAAIGWAAAIVVANLVPLVQLAMTVRLHPFGRGTCIAAVLSALSFGVLPVAARGLLGHGVIPSLAAIACGCAVMAVGLFRFRADLNLAAMPGAAQLAGIARRAQTSGWARSRPKHEELTNDTLCTINAGIALSTLGREISCSRR